MHGEGQKRHTLFDEIGVSSYSGKEQGDGIKYRKLHFDLNVLLCRDMVKEMDWRQHSTALLYILSRGAGIRRGSKRL